MRALAVTGPPPAGDSTLQARVPFGAGPLAAADRLLFVDLVRGAAIVGVLISYTLWSLGAPPPESWSTLDRVLDGAFEVLVDAKFLTTFCFLFGAGVAQQWRSLETRGQDVRRFHLRRMAFLFLVGLAHAVVLRNGDILAPYALLGVVLLAVRGVSTPHLVGLAVAMAMAPYIAQAALQAAGSSLPAEPLGGLPDNSWRHYWSDNWAWLRHWYAIGPIVSWPRMLATMLVGVVAERARLLQRLALDRRLGWRMLAISLPVAVVGRAGVAALAWAWDPAQSAVARPVVLSQLYWLAAWGLAAAYLSGSALLCQRSVWVKRLGWLREVGRMAFTNYILQAATIVPVCIWLGLFDAVTPTRGLVLAAVVLAIEVMATRWWLRRHAYGPLEGAWRAWTYRGVATPRKPRADGDRTVFIA